MKIITLAEQAVAKKDFGEIWNSKMARTTLLLVPVLLILPIVFLVAVLNVPLDQINDIDKMMRLLPNEAQDFNTRQAMMYLTTNMLYPMFFLMIPLMMSSVSAASSFVGEKERGTLETLLLTPLSMKQIFKAKIVGCISLSALATVISFVVFSIITSVGDILLQMPFFLNWNWIVLVLFLAPGVTVFGVVFIVIVSARSSSYIESIQTSGYIVVPLLFLFIGQLAGLFQLNALIFLIIAVAVIVIDFFLWIIAAHLFTPEKLLQ